MRGASPKNTAWRNTVHRALAGSSRGSIGERSRRAIDSSTSGGFALAHYGRPRYTKDLDLWVDPAGDNPERLFRALANFGAALDGLEPDDFRDPDCVFQIGVEPLRIGILTDISGVAFDSAWNRRIAATYVEVPVYVVSVDDLIANKRASGRPRDLRDVEALLEDRTP